MNTLIVSDIQSFFNFLNTNEKEIFTCTLMNCDSTRVLPGYGQWFVTVKEILRELPALHTAHGATLHTTLNQTNLQGRKIKDVTACRVLCVDLDRHVSVAELKDLIERYEIGMVVESSPDKYHLYWRCCPSLGLDVWKGVQLGLNHRFDGDTNLSQLNHNIRVPGVLRITKEEEEFIPSIKYLVPDSPALTYNDLLGVFPWLPEGMSEAQAARKETRKAIKGVRTVTSSGDSVNIANMRALEQSEGRNSTLYNVLFHFIKERADGFREFDNVGAEAQALNAQFVTPLDDEELMKVLQSAWDRGFDARTEKEAQEQASLALLTPETVCAAELPAGAPLHNGNGTHAHTGDSVTVETARSLFDYDYSDPLMRDNRYTEQGIAARAMQRFGGQIVRVGKSIYAFNETERVWKTQDSDSSPELYSFVHQCARDLIAEPGFRTLFCMQGPAQSALKTRQAQEKFLSIRILMQSIKVIKNLTSVKTLRPDEFDACPWLFYCQNGALDMRTGELRPVQASDYLMSQSSVVYDPTAEAPGWAKFISEIFENNADPQAMIDFMQEVFGYSISGSINEQVLFLHSGDGCNGKSKLLAALAAIAGDYSTYTDPDDLVRSKTGFVKSTERFGAKIEGKRVAIVDDIDVKTIWNETFVKMTTSPTIRARGEYERSRTITNRCVLHLGLNVAPTPDAENYGLLRRMCIIPYNVRFKPDAHVSNEIDKMIRDEAAGILRWAVEGYQRYLSHGGTVSYPLELTATAEEYKEDNFKLESVIDELFEAPSSEENGTWEWLSDLTVDVNTYLRQAGESIQVSPEELGRGLRRKQGFSIKKVRDPERRNAFRAVLVKLKFERPDRQHLASKML